MWRDYRLRVVPVEAKPIQVAETQRAFYAGAIALFRILLKNVGPNNESIVEDEQLAQFIHEEFQEFAKSFQTSVEN